MVEGCANPGECKSRPARYFLKNHQGGCSMQALILGLGIPAMIALMIITVIGAVKAALAVTEAVLGWIRHELLMRPKERYYRMGGAL